MPWVCSGAMDQLECCERTSFPGHAVLRSRSTGRCGRRGSASIAGRVSDAQPSGHGVCLVAAPRFRHSLRLPSIPKYTLNGHKLNRSTDSCNFVDCRVRRERPLGVPSPNCAPPQRSSVRGLDAHAAIRLCARLCIRRSAASRTGQRGLPIGAVTAMHSTTRGRPL